MACNSQEINERMLNFKIYFMFVSEKNLKWINKNYK